MMNERPGSTSRFNPADRASQAVIATAGVTGAAAMRGRGQVLKLHRFNTADLPALNRQQLLTVLSEIQRHTNQTDGYRAEVVGALDQLNEQDRSPHLSPHAELRDATGVSEQDARRIARTAKKAREHARVLESLSQGDITTVQAESLCDARVSEEVREQLLAAALSEHSDLTRQRVHEAESANETAMQRFKRQREARGAGWRRDHEGMLKIWARFDPRTGAQIETALETLRHQYWINDKQVRVNRRSPAQRDADVLAYALAGLTDNENDERAIERLHRRSHGHGDDHNRNDGNSRSDSDSAVRLPAAQINVLIDLDALRQATDAAGVTDSGIELPAELVRAMACDAQLIPMILGAPGDPADIGRTRRTVPARLRRLLNARDRHCKWPGCNQPPSRCDAHHIVHWADGGPTDLRNLVLLCHRHHHHLHEHGYRMIRQPDGTWTTNQELEPKPEPSYTANQARAP